MEVGEKGMNKQTEEVVTELRNAAKWFEEHGRNTNTIIIEICKRAEEVINNQDAEIERYKGVIKLLEKGMADAKFEAVKGFGHMLMDKAENGVIYAMDIPDYVIEMAGAMDGN